MNPLDFENFLQTLNSNTTNIPTNNNAHSDNIYNCITQADIMSLTNKDTSRSLLAMDEMPTKLVSLSSGDEPLSSGKNTTNNKPKK